MFELNNKIRILFFIYSIILSVHALEISILNVLSDFKCKTKIITKTYVSAYRYNRTALQSYYYEAFYQKTKVIAYIVDETRFEEIANSDALGIRMEIAQELGRHNYEMVVFGINNCQNDDFDVITAFLHETIKPHPNQIAFEIVTMGEGSFNRFYSMIPPVKLRYGKYKEESQIYNGFLKEHLRTSFPMMSHRSKRPDATNIKEVQFFENKNCKRNYSSEARWPIDVKNGEYIPAFHVNLNRIEYNFLRRYSDVNYHILVVSGKDYIRLTTGNQKPVSWFEDIKKIMENMSKNNEILFIMGCFNFDWSEIGIVSQIILTHSKTDPKFPTYNVFTAGIGMFDTIFDNPNKDDDRKLQQSSNNELIEFVKKCNGGAMRTKTIEILNLNPNTSTPNVTKYQIDLVNGRYEKTDYFFRNHNPNAKFAFIVIDSTEMNDQHIFSVAQTNPHVRTLQSNGIELFVMKLINFRLYDLHIVPEWIESNRHTMPPNRITLLGGGSCSTIFQYVSPEYQITYSLHNVANELKEIREAFVATAYIDNKNIFQANINVEKFWVQKIPMHTINGFYDPVVISNTNMIYTNQTNILFLIMKADKFIKMMEAAHQKRPTLMTEFRQSIASYYPWDQWTVYFVGLNDFAENDLHLFAEYVKLLTNDSRPLREFVYTFGDNIYYQSSYEYRDTLPFSTAMNMPLADVFTEFFHWIDVYLLDTYINDSEE